MKLVKTLTLAVLVATAPLSALADDSAPNTVVFDTDKLVSEIMFPLGDDGFQMFTLEEIRSNNEHLADADLDTVVKANTPIFSRNLA